MLALFLSALVGACCGAVAMGLHSLDALALLDCCRKRLNRPKLSGEEAWLLIAKNPPFRL